MNLIRSIIVLLLLVPFFAGGQTGCTISNYTGAYILRASDYPYTSPSSGITVNAVLGGGLGTLNNFSYNCGGNAYNTASPAWWINNATKSVTLTFSVPVSEFSVVVNGVNVTEEFYINPTVGSVAVSNFCTPNYIAINGGTAVRNVTTAYGSMITVTSTPPAGATTWVMTHNGLASGARYAVLDCFVPAGVLPIELLNFNAECSDQDVELIWSTVSEINNDFFTIERSTDGIEFEEIGTVNGAGNSSNLLTYSFMDDYPLLATTYYRLKQTDFNGKFTYSDIVANECGKGNINVYPNPVENELTIQLSADMVFPLNVDIKDYLGRSVYEKVITIPTELIKINLDGQTSSGVYFLNVVGKETTISRKFLKH